jgi:two-component sensor histidine kinase
MWYEIGQWLVRRTQTRLNRFLFVFATGMGAALFEALLDTWLTRNAGKHWRLALDAGSIGLLVSLITYIEIVAVQFRRKRIAEEMQVVAELNHQVRNALQTISYVVRLPETENQVEMIEGCVRRIDRTLRELFPSQNVNARTSNSDRLG